MMNDDVCFDSTHPDNDSKTANRRETELEASCEINNKKKKKKKSKSKRNFAITTKKAVCTNIIQRRSLEMK